MSHQVVVTAAGDALKKVRVVVSDALSGDSTVYEADGSAFTVLKSAYGPQGEVGLTEGPPRRTDATKEVPDRRSAHAAMKTRKLAAEAVGA
jgi:hypothetical protein